MTDTTDVETDATETEEDTSDDSSASSEDTSDSESTDDECEVSESDTTADEVNEPVRIDDALRHRAAARGIAHPNLAPLSGRLGEGGNVRESD